MKNKITLSVFACLLLCAALLAADYKGLFGITESSKYLLQEVRIRAYDKDDKTPIIGVRIRCFQQNNGNACSQRDSGKLGIISIILPTTKITRSSFLFEQGYRYQRSLDPNIQIMLIHVDYVSKIEIVEVAKLLNLEGEIMKVDLKARMNVVENQE